MPNKRQATGGVVIVPAGRWGYTFYQGHSAYSCPPGRRIRPPLNRMGFYAERAIQREFPRILARRDHVSLTQRTIDDLRSTDDPLDAKFAAVVEALIDNQHAGQAQQIFLLSGPEDTTTLRIPHLIRNSKQAPSGRGIAWVLPHRHIPEAALLAGPKNTDELDAWIAGEMSRPG